MFFNPQYNYSTSQTRLRQLLTLYEDTNKLSGVYDDVSRQDILRSCLAYQISAFDKYIHEAVSIAIIEFFIKKATAHESSQRISHTRKII